MSNALRVQSILINFPLGHSLLPPQQTKDNTQKVTAVIGLKSQGLDFRIITEAGKLGRQYLRKEGSQTRNPKKSLFKLSIHP